MKKTVTLSNALFLSYVVLTFYCLGAAMFTEWLEYRNWAEMSSFMSAADAAAWVVADSPNTLLWVTIPSAVLTVVVLTLFRYLPAAVPRGPLWGVLACHAVVWGIYLLVQLPLETQLDQTHLLNLLVHSDWVRKLAWLIEAPLAAYMTYRAFWPTAATRPAAVAAGSRHAAAAVSSSSRFDLV